MRRTCWLSVDYDYFVRSRIEWDWSHKESPFFRGGFIWMTRAAPFLMQGVDLVSEMDPLKYGRPRPDSFWDILWKLGYRFGDVQYYTVADSHAAAGSFFNEVAYINDGNPADVIVNFDAHHDMGYCKWSKLKGMVEKGTCTCDMWLGALMTWFPKLKSRIVFPDWMKEQWTIKEQVRDIRKHLPKSLWSRVAMDYFTAEDGTVSPIVIEPGEQLDVTAVFVCRSGAWVPPWLDKEFIDFVMLGSEEFGVDPVDAYAEQDMPALEPRPDFSHEQAVQMAEQWKAAMAGGIKKSSLSNEEDKD